jgi:hypothetical protein
MFREKVEEGRKRRKDMGYQEKGGEERENEHGTEGTRVREKETMGRTERIKKKTHKNKTKMS